MPITKLGNVLTKHAGTFTVAQVKASARKASKSKDIEKGLSKPKIPGKSFNGVSLGKDKDGYFVYTHRCRSKSYSCPEKIPQGRIDFVASTG